MQFLLLGIAAFLAVMVIGRLMLTAPAGTVARILKIAAVVVAAAVAIVLAATGRLGPAIATLIFLAPMFLRWRAIARRLKSATGPTPGQSSSVRTAHLEAVLDHDSGEMNARIIDGPSAGRMLSDCELDDLMALLAEYRHIDPQSAAIVEAYLDRVHGAAWRAGDEAGSSGFGNDGNGSRSSGSRESGGAGSRMTVEEARAALGVGPSATREDIKRAHRHLMKRFHPDHGGTDYLAAKLNEAKEILLEYVGD